MEPNDDSRAVLLRTSPPMDQVAHRWPTGSATPGSSASSTQQVGFWPALLTGACRLCLRYQALPDVAKAAILNLASWLPVAFFLLLCAQNIFCLAPVQSRG